MLRLRAVYRARCRLPWPAAHRRRGACYSIKIPFQPDYEAGGGDQNSAEPHNIREDMDLERMDLQEGENAPFEVFEAPPKDGDSRGTEDEMK